MTKIRKILRFKKSKKKVAALKVKLRCLLEEEQGPPCKPSFILFFVYRFTKKNFFVLFSWAEMVIIVNKNICLT